MIASIFAGIGLILAAPSAHAKTKIDIATQTSKTVCLEAEQRGYAIRAKGGLEIKANTSRILALIAKSKAKINATGEYEKWAGPSETDIGRVIFSINDCRKAIFLATLQSLDREHPQNQSNSAHATQASSKLSRQHNSSDHFLAASQAPLYLYDERVERPVREGLKFLAGKRYRMRPFGCDDRAWPGADADSINCSVWVQSDDGLSIIKSGLRAELETASGIRIRASRFVVLSDVTMPGMTAKALDERILANSMLDTMVDKQIVIPAVQTRQQVLITYFFKIKDTSAAAALRFTLGGDDPVTRFPIVTP